MTNPPRLRLAGAALFFLGVTASGHASAAMGITLTLPEFLALPPYCAATFTQQNLASIVPGDVTLPTQQEADRWSQVLGQGFYYAHHLCVGLVWLQRGLVAPDARQRQQALNKSAPEIEFTLKRTPRDQAFFSIVATYMGVAMSARREYQAADGFFRQAMAAHPEVPDSYVAAATSLQKRGQLSEARDALERGVAATQGQSADIHYALGLLLVKMDLLDEAVEHANAAYALGYPLQGLRNKLIAAGKPPAP